MENKSLTTPFVFDVQEVIEQAVKAGTAVEVMEKLLQMRNLMKAEAAKEAYNIALSEFQAACPTIQKKKKVAFKDTKYSYAPLDEIIEQVKGLLKASGFSYTFDAVYADAAQTITCTARHIAGHSETASFRAPTQSNAGMNEIQKNGAAMTYAKRYAFCQVFGITTGDEDTDGAGQNGNGKPETPAKSAADAKYMAAIKKAVDELVYILGETAGMQTYKNMLAGLGYEYADEITDRATRETAYKSLVELVKQAKEADAKAKKFAAEKTPAKSNAAELGKEVADAVKGKLKPTAPAGDLPFGDEIKLTEAQQKLSDLLEANTADIAEFRNELIRLTTFTGRDGKKFDGYWNIKDMSDKAADVTRHKLEAEIKAKPKNA